VLFHRARAPVRLSAFLRRPRNNPRPPPAILRAGSPIFRKHTEKPAASIWHFGCIAPLCSVTTKQPGENTNGFDGTVQGVLDGVRPFLQADGGDIELLTVNGNSAEVRLTGMCTGCPRTHMTLHVGVEAGLREEIPEFETLRLV
jgi:Fe-S cluster biogenesis protein NfuA